MKLPYRNKDFKSVQKNFDYLVNALSSILGPSFGTPNAAILTQAIPATANWTSNASFSKLGRLVVLQGDFSKTGGTGTPAAGDIMGILPAIAIPPVNMQCEVTTQNNDARGEVIIDTAGNIIWRVGSIVEVDHTYLDGISYVVKG